MLCLPVGTNQVYVDAGIRSSFQRGETKGASVLTISEQEKDDIHDELRNVIRSAPHN